MTGQLTAIIDAAWDARDAISSATHGEVRDAVQTALAGLDDGSLRVAEKLDGSWQVNQWLKKAVLLSFRLNDNVVVDGGAAGAPAYDKVPSKFTGWGESRFRDAGFRVVPGAVARRGSPHSRSEASYGESLSLTTARVSASSASGSMLLLAHPRPSRRCSRSRRSIVVDHEWRTSARRSAALRV
jgi:hypothetical protein